MVRGIKDARLNSAGPANVDPCISIGEHAFAFSRRDPPESCLGHPQSGRVQGMPGARRTRGPVRNEVGSCAHEHTGEAEASGIPCAMALRLMPRSPRRRIRLVTVAGGLKGLRSRLGSQHLRRLDASNGRQDHTVLPYAQTSVVLRACHRSRGSTRPATAIARRRSHVHRIPSRVRDDARPPLLPERDGRN
jgi:hypothetical protein